jgi:hypothetical protein
VVARQRVDAASMERASAEEPKKKADFRPEQIAGNDVRHQPPEAHTLQRPAIAQRLTTTAYAMRPTDN